MNHYFALLALVLSGCVTMPIPPIGENAGAYGMLEVKVMYHPNLSTIINKVRGEEPKPTSSK